MVDHPMSGRTITIVHILLWFRTMQKFVCNLREASQKYAV